MNSCSRLLLSLLAIVAGGTTLPTAEAQAAAAVSALSTSAELFFKPPTISKALVSPNGQRVGFLALKDDLAYAFALLETATRQQRVVLQPENQSIINFWWKTDDLLLLLIDDLETGARSFATYEFSTNNYRLLSLVSSQLQYIYGLPNSPEEMLFAGRASGANDLVRFNVRTGGNQEVEKDPQRVSNWFVNVEGEAIAAWQEDEKEWILWSRKSAADRWQPRRMPKDREFPDFLPLGVARDGRRLVSLDYRQPDEVGLVALNPVSGESETLVGGVSSIPTGVSFWGFQEQLGIINYERESIRQKFLSPAAEACFQKLERAFPGLKLDPVSFSRDDAVAIVLAKSDRVAGEYLVVETATGAYLRLGPRQAPVTRNLTTPRRPFQFKASDGLAVSGVVTLPEGKTRPPLILYLDGGFRAREVSDDNLVRYLASQGYAIAEVDHRGTVGFSRAFRDAGLFQRTIGIPRDLNEAVAFLDQQGWVDGSRVIVYCSRSRAVDAFAFAAQSKAVKAVLAFSPITTTSEANPKQLEGSNRPVDEMFKLGGGSSAFFAYRKAIDAEDNASKAAVPVFVYHRNIYRRLRLTASPNFVRVDESFIAVVKRKARESESLKSEELTKELGFANPTEIIEWKLEARAAERALGFLRKLGIQ